MSKRIGANFLVAALALAACAGAASAQGRKVILDDNDANTQVALSVGDTLVVKLTSNPSTGYSWNVYKNNNALLQPVAERTQQGRDAMPGSNGAQVFRFRAVKAGGEALALTYQRPFEKNVDPAKKFRVLVVVDSPRAKVVTVTDEDNHSRVQLDRGDTLVVRLPSTQSSGYFWTVAENDARLLQPVGRMSGQAPGGMLGRAGAQTFQFKAVAPGGERLTLLYQKSQQPGVQASRKFELLVSIARP